MLKRSFVVVMRSSRPECSGPFSASSPAFTLQGAEAPGDRRFQLLGEGARLVGVHEPSTAVLAHGSEPVSAQFSIAGIQGDAVP